VLAADTSGFDISVFANYGVLGAMFVFVVGALLTGNLVAGWVYKRLEKQMAEQAAKCEQMIKEQGIRFDAEIERERAEKIALRTRMDEQVIPLLSDTGHLLREALRTLGRDGRDKGAGT
jgi:hypothetical protein